MIFEVLHQPHAPNPQYGLNKGTITKATSSRLVACNKVLKTKEIYCI